MRSFLSRRAMLAAASVLALAAAGIAVAGPAPSSMSLVSATFSTGAPTNSHSQTCTAANNDQITVTDATYTGTVSSADSRLAGPITIDVQSIYDATANLGTLTGDVRIDTTATPPNHFHAILRRWTSTAIRRAGSRATPDRGPRSWARSRRRSALPPASPTGRSGPRPVPPRIRQPSRAAVARTRPTRRKAATARRGRSSGDRTTRGRTTTTIGRASGRSDLTGGREGRRSRRRPSHFLR